MPSTIGKRAIVIGAGIGGLTAAAAVAPYFEHVVVIERDALPTQPSTRPGTPQAKHVHALLAGGQRALEQLFPGFERDLERGGALRVRVGLDLRMERPGYDPFPKRDLGFDSYALSRALIEFVTRACLDGRANVEIRQRCRVERLTADASRRTVTGVEYVDGDGARVTLGAELVAESSGRGDLALELLDSVGLPRPSVTTIGVDIAYASAIYEIPNDASDDWKGVFHLPMPPSSRGALMLPLEGRRWILTLAGRHGDNPPRDDAGFMAFVQGFRTPTLYNAIRGAKRLGEIVGYRFPESIHHHYERLETFPSGLVLLADAVCRFNPVWGQGMSVAAQEACALSRLLASRSSEGAPLDGLAQAFFAEAAALIATPWAQAVIPDFIHPQTRGERPADFEQSLMLGLAMTKLAARDPAVHKLTAEVGSLLKPRTVYFDPELRARVMAVMAER
jgi:2-polyprenyl-6-methoxyphenol hydroxylase-like FAD-dependent oxidoreductase